MITYSVIVVVSISFASIFVLLSGAPASVCAFWRLLISTLILLTTSLLTGKLGGTTKLFKDFKSSLLTIASGTALATHFLLWMESLFYVSVAVSVTVVVSFPLINLIIDYLLLKERVSRVQVIGLITGFTSIALFMNPKVSTVESSYGVLLAFLGALAASTYFSIGRVLRRYVGIIEYSTSVYGIASLVLLIYNLLLKVNLVNYPLMSYLYFILLATVPMLGGHTLMNYMLKYMKSSTVTSLALGEPIGATILAYFILKQSVSPNQLILMVITLTSVAIVIKEESRMERINTHIVKFGKETMGSTYVPEYLMRGSLMRELEIISK